MITLFGHPVLGPEQPPDPVGSHLCTPERAGCSLHRLTMGGDQPQLFKDLLLGIMPLGLNRSLWSDFPLGTVSVQQLDKGDGCLGKSWDESLVVPH